jgi:hypothetical protein
MRRQKATTMPARIDEKRVQFRLNAGPGLGHYLTAGVHAFAFS